MLNVNSKKTVGALLAAPGLKILVCSNKPDLSRAILLVCKDMDGIVPTEIQVIPAGFHATPKGDFICDGESARLVMEDFESHKNDMVTDYEHQTFSGAEAPASGWIKKLINKGADGIWAVVEWTEKAKQYIANKEYRYVSPVFLKRVKDNKVVRLINVALTNQPNIDGMVPLINKLQIMQNKEKEEVMDKELLKLLGLAEAATLADVIACINKLKADVAGVTAVVANKTVLDALGLKEGTGESEVVATIMAHKQSATALEGLTAQVHKLTDELQKKETEDVEAMVNKAIEGDEKGSKLLPAQKDWALDYAKKDLPGFKIFLNKATYQVIKEKVAGDTPAEKGPVLDAAQLQVNKLMGINNETFKKFAPKKEE